MKCFLICLLGISVLSVLITVFDKLSAKAGGRRIPEKVLFLFAALGGSVAMYITMRLIRHKTQHKSFMIGIPVIFIVEAAAVIALYVLLHK